MPTIIDATVGGSAANSYATLAEAVDYMSKRLNATNWTGTDTVKEQALITATFRIDQENFLGYRTSSTQALKWPRSNVPVVGEEYGGYYASDAIPVPIKKAVYEYALELLTNDTLTESNLSNYKSVSVGPIEVEFNQPVSSGLLPDMVSRLLRGLRVGGSGVVMVRG